MIDPHDFLIRRLSRHSPITSVEQSTLSSLPVVLRTYRADQPLSHQGQSLSEACMVMRGLIAGYTMTSSGVRQITSFYVPGDLPDLQALHLHTVNSALCSMTTSVLAFIPHAALHEITARSEVLTRALWRETLIQGAVYREWVVNLGARPSAARLAHIFCELFVRLTAAGVARLGGYDLPLSQTELSEAAGLSTVHVNRVLRELREAGLVQLQRGRVEILDWDRLRVAADFDGGYLHLKEAAASGPRRPADGLERRP